MTDEDRSRFRLALELDPNPRSKNYGAESLVAQTVTVHVENREVVVDLKTLIVDHLRQLCKNVGAVNCGSANKFDCRKALATYIKYQDELERKGLTATSTASRLTSTICRAVNVVFSEQFVDDFFSVNDRMSRRNHETKKERCSHFLASKATLVLCLLRRGHIPQQQNLVLLLLQVTSAHWPQTKKQRTIMKQELLLVVMISTTMLIRTCQF